MLGQEFGDGFVRKVDFDALVDQARRDTALILASERGAFAKLFGDQPLNELGQGIQITVRDAFLRVFFGDNVQGQQYLQRLVFESLRCPAGDFNDHRADQLGIL